MQEVLNLVKTRKQEFAKLPLLNFMQDKSVNPKQRLSFAPCMAHFVMSFSDFNKYIFRTNASSDDTIQQIVNQYTYEDEEHWSWFLEDIKNLGFDHISNSTDILQFIWGEETKITRQIAYLIAGYTYNSDAIVKITAIQSLEAMAEVFFSRSSQIASELQAITKQEYLYFGNLHLDVENDHTMSTSEAEDCFAEIELTQSQLQEALNVVEAMFKILTEWTYELLAYAHNHPIEPATSEEAKALEMACV